MEIGMRLRQLREEKKLSQGHIEQRTGLLRCYISRVENGHTVPAVETLEKFARALEVPMWKLFTYEEVAVPALVLKASKQQRLSSKDERFLMQISRLLAKIGQRERTLLLAMAKGLARAAR